MPWLVDTCVLIDVAEADPKFGAASARLLQAKLREGLVVSPVSYAELAPVFDGSLEMQDEFLSAAGVSFDAPWKHEDTLAAHAAWWSLVRRRRGRPAPRRPIADVLIGAMACRVGGLITRNGRDFAPLFPDLAIRDPTSR